MADLRVFVGLVANRTFVLVAVSRDEVVSRLKSEPDFIMEVGSSTGDFPKKPPPELEEFLECMGLFGEAPPREIAGAALEYFFLKGIEAGARVASERLEKTQEFSRVLQALFGNLTVEEETTEPMAVPVRPSVAPPTGAGSTLPSPAPDVGLTTPPPGHDDPTDRPPKVDCEDPGNPAYRQPKGC